MSGHDQSLRTLHGLFLVFLLLGWGMTACSNDGNPNSGGKNPSVLTATAHAAFTPGALLNPFRVASVDMTVSPASITRSPCGNPITVTYSATIAVLPSGSGGTVQFLYSTDNGRSTHAASVFLAYYANEVVYTFTWSGILSPGRSFPGAGSVKVTNPNPVASMSVRPTGTCLPVSSSSTFRVTS